MKALSTAELLGVWEQGWDRPPAERALLLLAAACPEVSLPALQQLTVGQRDALLLTLREWLFGSRLESVVNCSQCGERLELTFSVEDVRAAPAVGDASALDQPAPLSLEQDGYQVRFRLPALADLAASASPEQLLARCLISARRNDKAWDPGELPPEIIQEIALKMAAADPQADMQVALNCPACGRRWLAGFDAAAFFWDEINAWAQRTLIEVHQLARAYGWAEGDILEMSPFRRQIYLNLTGEL
jgi:hypothetical protein